MSNNTHTLKTWPEHFRAIKTGIKSFEFRKNDRDFKVGDILHLREFDPDKNKYTGDEIRVKVTYILTGGSFPGIEHRYVIMAITPKIHFTENIMLADVEYERPNDLDIPDRRSFQERLKNID